MSAKLTPLASTPDFAGFGLRVGRFFHLENFRRANLRDPNLPHDRDLGVSGFEPELYKSIGRIRGSPRTAPPNRDLNDRSGSVILVAV